MFITASTLSARDISHLRTEAGEAGDLDMVATCDRAAAGDELARVAVCEAIVGALSADDIERLVADYSAYAD